MPYEQRTAESHPPGYNGLYSAQELKKGIHSFIIKEREETGRTQHSTKDIITGLKNLYNIEFDFHSVEYVMRNMMGSEGSKEVGTETINSVKKKCEDGLTRVFVATHEHNKSQYPHGLDEPGYSDSRSSEANEIPKSEANKPDIPTNLTEDQLNEQYKKLSMEFAMGSTYNPGTFPEFKNSLGY